MGLKLIIILLLFYYLLSTFNLITWLAILCYVITMFILLPLIYYANKTSHHVVETKNFFKFENYLLTPAIKKRGFFKTLSKVSNVDVTEQDTQFTSITPFPSRRVEEVIDDLIYEIIKYYVLPYAEANNWKFKNTEAFLRKFLKKFASEIVHRMSVIDWNSFFCNSIFDHVRSHVNFLKSRNNQNDDNNYFMGRKTEVLFTEAIANRLLRSLLDDKYIQCEVVYQFCLGLLAHQVIVKTVDYYCDPVNQNQWLFKALIERKVARSKLNKQIPHFQYDMSFENFFKLVESIHDINEVKQIKDKLQSEVRMAEVLKFTQISNDDKKQSKISGSSKSKGTTKYFKGQLLTKRDLKCYCNQLNTLLETVNTKLKMMGHSKNSPTVKTLPLSGSKRMKSLHRNSKTEKQTLSKKFKLKVTRNFSKGKALKTSSERSSIINECIPYESIMDNNEGRKFFKEFLNNTNYSRTVELIEMLTHMQENPSDHHVIAQGIVKRYVRSSPPAFEFDKSIVKEMEEFLRGNATEKVFERAKVICDNEVKKRWYPYFILSPHYTRFTRHLAKELSILDQRQMKIASSETENTDLDSGASGDESAVEEDDLSSCGLLFNFTEGLQANNPSDESTNQLCAVDLNQSAGNVADDDDDEEEEEDDGFLKPKFEEIIQPYGGNETIDYYQGKICKLNKKIEVKEKAYNAGIAVSNRMPLNKKEKSKMKLDLKVVKEDLQGLYEKRERYQYNLTRMDRWILSVGKWNAFVYEIVLPEPRRGTSLDLGFLPTLGESKQTGAMATDREDSFTEEDTKEVLIFVMVSLGMTEQMETAGEDNGWLVRHTVKDFQALKAVLAQLLPALDRVPLPKVPQRLFSRRKYTDNDLGRIKRDLDGFIKFIMKEPVLAQSEAVFRFFCSSVETNPLNLEGDAVSGPLTSLANTISDAGAKVKLMAKIPSRLVQKVLSNKKRSASISSQDSDHSDGGSNSRVDKKNSLRRSSAYENLSGSLKHKLRRMSTAKDISMSAFELLEELIQLRKSLTLTRRSMITFVQSFFGKNLTQILTENVALIKAEATIFHSLQKYRDSFRIESSLSTQASAEGTAESSFSTTAANRMQPSASAFLAASEIESVCRLSKTNSSSSPTMQKARGYSRNSATSCEALVSTGPNNRPPKIPSSVPDCVPMSIRGDGPTWQYSIKCDEAVKRLLWEAVPEYLKTLFGTMSVADSVGFVFESLQSRHGNKALVYRVLQSLLDRLLEDDCDQRLSSESLSR